MGPGSLTPRAPQPPSLPRWPYLAPVSWPPRPAPAAPGSAGRSTAAWGEQGWGGKHCTCPMATLPHGQLGIALHPSLCPPSPNAQPRPVGGFPVPWGSPGQALTAAQATPGSAGLDTDPRLWPRGGQAWPRDRGLPVPLGGLPTPARRPLQIHERHSSPCSLGALRWPSCPCHGHRVSRLHLCPCTHENTTPPPSPSCAPRTCSSPPWGRPRPPAPAAAAGSASPPGSSSPSATSGCGGTRTPGSGVALPGFGGRAHGNPARGEGRGLRELPRFQHGGDALARLGGCEGKAERLGPAGAAHPAHPHRYTLTPHTTEPVPPLAPGTHAPSPVGVSVPPAPPRGHVADTSRLCHRGRERPRPAQPAGNRNSNTQTHAARPGAAPGGTATRPL